MLAGVIQNPSCGLGRKTETRVKDLTYPETDHCRAPTGLEIARRVSDLRPRGERGRTDYAVVFGALLCNSHKKTL